MPEKILVNASYGTDDVERATVPFIVASAAGTIGYLADGARTIM